MGCVAELLMLDHLILQLNNSDFIGVAAIGTALLVPLIGWIIRASQQFGTLRRQTEQLRRDVRAIKRKLGIPDEE